MFKKQIRLRKTDQFGFIDVVVGLLPSLINVGGSLASAKMQASAAKEIAASQQATALAAGKVQERIAQLQLAALQVPAVAAAAPTTVSTLVAGFTKGEVFGIPTIYMLLGGGVLTFILLRKKKEK